jgi:hypothetical protein
MERIIHNVISFTQTKHLRTGIQKYLRETRSRPLPCLFWGMFHDVTEDPHSSKRCNDCGKSWHTVILQLCQPPPRM